jgi:nicotinamide-nucleotide amidase
MFPDDLIQAATTLSDRLRQAGLRIATAESCTGGLLAGLMTEIPGSSDIVERGYVTYSNAAKAEAIGVPTDLIATHGAVSAEVARAMAQGALRASRADIAVAITGVAGPGGGSAEKPVGLVHLAVARRGMNVVHRECRFGDRGRGAVRIATLYVAIAMAAAAVGPHPA